MQGAMPAPDVLLIWLEAAVFGPPGIERVDSAGGRGGPDNLGDSLGEKAIAAATRLGGMASLGRFRSLSQGCVGND